MHTGARPREAGFTLLEAVVALGIVALVVTSYLGIRTSALADGIEARNWRLAREIAQEKLSEVVAGALEVPPQPGGDSVDLSETYPGFSYRILIGESAIGNEEENIANAAAEEDTQTRDRSEWQQNRDTFRKAQARGLNATEYQDQIAAEEYERRLEGKAPSETDFEQVAVVVYFPKVNPKYENQKESFVIKTKISTLALSGLTPEQAKQIADTQAEGAATAGSTPSAGGAPSGGAEQGGAK